MPTIVVAIENYYTCGFRSKRRWDIAAPKSADDSAVANWFLDDVFEYTGEPHPCGPSDGSHYVATVVSAPEGFEFLEGRREEWTD